MANTSEPMRTTMKLSLADETHRVTLNTAALSLDTLRALVPNTFVAAPPQEWTLVYTDNEGDLVTVASAAEFDEARRVLLDLDATAATGSTRTPTMHFRVMAKVGVKDQLTPAVLNAVDELSQVIARLASDTRESIAQSAYLERGRATVVHSASKTRELFDSARREVSQRLRIVQARIVGGIERRRSSAGSAAEASVVSLTAASEPQGISSAADAVSVVARHSQHVLESDNESDGDDSGDGDAEDSDDEPDALVIAPVDLPHAAAAGDDAVVPADREEPSRAETVVDESDAETVASSSSDSDDDDGDDEWDVVPDVWNAEVALIRSILPHVHVEGCVAMLRKHGGDLEAAINELTDE